MKLDIVNQNRWLNAFIFYTLKSTTWSDENFNSNLVSELALNSIAKLN